MSVEPRLSFGRAVDAHERARPQYARDAVDYLATRREDRDEVLADIRALVGHGTAEFPMLTTVIAADRA